MPTVGFAIAFIRRGDGSAAFTALKKKNHEFILMLVAITAEVITKEVADKTLFFCKEISMSE